MAILEKESTCKETLQVTEARKNREWGLIHINDSFFQFFMAREQQSIFAQRPGGGGFSPKKNDGGTRRTFLGVKFVDWYRLGC